MDILLDTNILIWALTDDPKLSNEARKMITNDSNDIFYSTISLFEIAIKHSKFPEIFPFTSREVFECALDANIDNIPLFNKHIFQLDTLKIKDNSKHKDPFDMVLLAQAKRGNKIFLTHDQMLEDYEESFIKIV